jgi:membrane fusion protein (multidrug efflux system)
MVSRVAIIAPPGRHCSTVMIKSAPAHPRAPACKRCGLLRLAVVLAVWLHVAAATPKPAAAADQPPALVAVAQVFEKEVAPTTALVGNVLFDQSAGISPEISGLIAGHHMIEGAAVRRGDVLVRLNTDFVIKDMQMLDQQIAQIDLRLENARKNLHRLETLYRQDAATEKNYDDLSFQVKELLTEKEHLRLSLAKKKLELDKSLIRAPYNGLILRRYKSQGEWVSPGQPVCDLAASDDVVVRVALPEGLIPLVTVGQSLTLSITSAAEPLQGKIKAVVPSVDVKSKTFDIKVGIDYTPGLFHHMSALVNVPTGPVRKLVMIKRDALVRFQGQEFVYTVQEGRARMLPIQVSAVDGEYLGVDTPQIAAGMLVVIDGNERLRPDQPVTVVDNPGK